MSRRKRKRGPLKTCRECGYVTAYGLKWGLCHHCYPKARDAWLERRKAQAEPDDQRRHMESISRECVTATEAKILSEELDKRAEETRKRAEARYFGRQDPDEYRLGK